MIIVNQSRAQVYQPIGMDTSCYWVTSGTITDGLQQCIFQNTLVVKKDTMINGLTYHVCSRYLSSLSCNPSNSYLASNVAQASNPIFREDTTAKVLYTYLNGVDVVAINFNLNVNDTLKDCLQNNSRVIDSVNFISYNGTTRRTTYSAFPGYLGVNYVYETIEGIGTNQGLDCPQWGSYLVCYSKNGIEQYSQTSCTKPSPLSVKSIFSESLTTYYDGRKVFILNPNSRELTLNVLSISGQMIRSLKTSDKSCVIQIDDLSKGIYIVSIDAGDESRHLKVIN